MKPRIGIVVIGRNEGNNLTSCFQSLAMAPYPLIYVDSASTDDSVAIAKTFKNVTVVQLSPLSPLTAARGRNAGVARLNEMDPRLEYIQFVDGDSRIEPGWLEEAARVLSQREDVAIVAGILKEFEATNSIFKKISALEWEAKPGEIKATGGICMCKVTAIQQVEGFNELLIGAEDTDFCYRIRKKGWKILHIPVPMGVHDSSIKSFRDFWRRSMRTGYAFSQVSQFHWNDSERLFARENISTFIFGGIIPILTLTLAPWTGGFSLLLLLVYPLLFWRIYRKAEKHWSKQEACLYAASCILAKFPGFIGACKFYINSLWHK